MSYFSSNAKFNLFKQNYRGRWNVHKVELRCNNDYVPNGRVNTVNKARDTHIWLPVIYLKTFIRKHNLILPDCRVNDS